MSAPVSIEIINRLPAISSATLGGINNEGRNVDQSSEFFKALYWKFEGRHVRLTTYSERDLPDAELTKLAFERARVNNLSPLFQRIFVGSFLRNSPEKIDDYALDKGVYLYV